jgi:dimethylaniline monooxygenase (N-oxide forming)
VYEYLQSYADHFELRPHIQLNSTIKNIQRVNGEWQLTVESKDGATKTKRFAKLMVATGTFQKPKRPDVPGIETFAGDVRHAITFSPNEDYRDKRTLIIGFHASAVDVASSLSGIASKLYISRKNGVVILPKYDDSGRTFDQSLTLGLMFFQMFAERYCPKLWWWMLDTMLVKMSKKAFPEVVEKYGLLPAASIETTTPVIVDQLIAQIDSGAADLIGAVDKVTGPKSVQLKDGTIIEDLDAIIFCTGYHFSIPFMPKEWDPYPVDGEPPKLYQNIFPLHSDPDVRNSLAFMGQGATPFPGFAMLETVSMATAQIWKGKEKLPPLKEMQQWYENNINEYREKKRRMKTDSTFYPVMLPMRTWWGFLDKTAGTDVLSHFSW